MRNCSSLYWLGGRYNKTRLTGYRSEIVVEYRGMSTRLHQTESTVKSCRSKIYDRKKDLNIYCQLIARYRRMLFMLYSRFMLQRGTVDHGSQQCSSPDNSPGTNRRVQNGAMASKEASELKTVSKSDWLSFRLCIASWLVFEYRRQNWLCLERFW